MTIVECDDYCCFFFDKIKYRCGKKKILLNEFTECRDRVEDEKEYEYRKKHCYSEEHLAEVENEIKRIAKKNNKK